MGPYDEVICEYPLPDGYDATGIVFHTKDLGCNLKRWAITLDGELVNPQGQVSGFSGILRLFYHNLEASTGKTVCTYDDTAPRIWAYSIWVDKGRTTEWMGQCSPFLGVVHVPRAEFRARFPSHAAPR